MGRRVTGLVLLCALVGVLRPAAAWGQSATDTALGQRVGARIHEAGSQIAGRWVLPRISAWGDAPCPFGMAWSEVGQVCVPSGQPSSEVAEEPTAEAPVAPACDGADLTACWARCKAAGDHACFLVGERLQGGSQVTALSVYARGCRGACPECCEEASRLNALLGDQHTDAASSRGWWSPETHAYGWITAIVDLASVGLLFASARQEEVLAPSLLLYALGGPVVHWAHGNAGLGFASLGLRVAAPVVVGYVAASLANGSCESDEEGTECASTPLVAGILAAFFGAVGVMVIDDVWLAVEPAKPGRDGASALLGLHAGVVLDPGCPAIVLRGTF